MKKIIVPILAFILATNIVYAKSPATLVQEGNQAFKDQQYDIAREKYESITDKDILSTGHIDFNKANCLFKNGDFDSAIELYRQAANNSSDKQLTASSKFNLGNSYFQKAQAIEQEKPKDAIEEYQQSARCYRQALDINNSDIEAAQNIALTRKKINELKEILKQQEQQQDQDQDQEQEQKDNDQDKQKDDKNKQEPQENQKQNSGDGDSEEEKQQQQSDNQQDEEEKEKQQQEQEQAQEEEEEGQESQEPKEIKQKQEIDPQAAQIIEDEKKRKERMIEIIRVQQKPAEKDW